MSRATMSEKLIIVPDEHAMHFCGHAPAHAHCKACAHAARLQQRNSYQQSGEHLAADLGAGGRACGSVHSPALLQAQVLLLCVSFSMQLYVVLICRSTSA